MRYDIQLLIDGVWSWAGVEPMPMTLSKARHCRNRLALQTAWLASVRATRIRVAKIS